MSVDTRYTVKKFNIRPIKSLGQNFLTDKNIVERIVDAAGIGSSDLVIEIGPGVGSMTAELAARAGRVVAVEIDRRLIPALEENLKDFSNVDIVNEDILSLDIKRDILDTHEAKYPDFKPDTVKVAANLPYYITTPIIMKFLEEEPGIDNMIFMVQKEVADRMIAKPGGKEYGALSVAVQFYSHPQRVIDVPPHCFIPQPGVDSTVIRLNILKEPPVVLSDRETFFKTVKAAFGHRRKTLVNALSNSGCFKKDKDQIKDILRELDIKENQRGETLSIEQFARLSNSFFE